MAEHFIIHGVIFRDPEDGEHFVIHGVVFEATAAAPVEDVITRMLLLGVGK